MHTDVNPFLAQAGHSVTNFIKRVGNFPDIL